MVLGPKRDFTRAFYEDKKLSDLATKVLDVYKRCDLARDQQQVDTLQMLGAIEARIEELISGLDEAYHQDGRAFGLNLSHLSEI